MTQQAGQRTIPYIPQLDGLRAVAVFLVFAEHFTYNEFIRDWSPGMVGVRTFFVLSGFLITSILLNQRGTAPNGMLARRFFVRRFFRLAPPFYLAIGLSAVLGIAGMRTDWWVHALYLSNFQIAWEQQWIGAGHFWTLAVEEQFYLLWFPAVILLPRRWLLPVIIGCLLFAPGFRMLMVFGVSTFIDVLLPSQIDSLAAGALVAIVVRTPALVWLDRVLLDRTCLVALSVIVLILLAPFPEALGQKPFSLQWVLVPLLVSFASASLIRQCVAARGTDFAWLAHPALVHMGKISYGLYVFHYLVPPALYLYVPAMEYLAEGPLKLVRSLIWIIVSFILAEFSWRFLEHPLMQRRRRLDPAGSPDSADTQRKAASVRPVAEPGE